MDAVSGMRGAFDRCSCGVALKGRLGLAYDEGGFRYFLEIEQKRSVRSGDPFLLLLVDLKEPPTASVHIDPMLASKLFSGLWRCLRETDFVGWYRDGCVVGAVLTQLANVSLLEASRLIRQRVSGALREGLAPDVAGRIRVRVHFGRGS